MNTAPTEHFIDRRNPQAARRLELSERRQFSDSRDGLDADVQELADAIDAFKRANNRRHVTLTEVVQVVKSLGYHK